MIVRITQTTIDPEDAPRATDIFVTSVKPALEALEGSEGIEMHLGMEEHSGDVLELVSISRWSSPEALEAAADSPAYREAMDALRPLFRATPLVHHFRPVG